MLYESADDAHLLRIEMCYWNESDQKHKMVAYCVSSFFDGRTTQRILKWNGHGFSF